MSIEKVLYTAHATVTGGRNGRARGDTGLELNLALPKEMGGTGVAGTNPEELFAIGYAACFMGALGLVAGKEKLALPPDTAIESAVGIGPQGAGYGIQAQLRVRIPGVPRERVQALIEKAHEVCPYSNATRGNIDVVLTALE